jgi:hypothetical protein
LWQFVAALRALAPDLMGSVQVVTQSTALLTNASDYWISVINAGRAFPLSAVRAVDEAMVEAGQVLTSLMHVADVLAVCSAGGTPTCLCGTETQRALHTLASTYVARPEGAAAGLTPPSVTSAPSISLQLKSLEAENAALDPVRRRRAAAVSPPPPLCRRHHRCVAATTAVSPPPPPPPRPGLACSPWAHGRCVCLIAGQRVAAARRSGRCAAQDEEGLLRAGQLDALPTAHCGD